MSYTLLGLEPALFEPLFGLDEATLAARGMRWMSVDEPIGFPCRISLEDAPVGERVLLLPFVHQDSRSAFRASGPIFVRGGVREARRIVGELPPYLTRRLLSVRAYDAMDDIVDAEVIDGAAAAPLIERYLARDEVSYLHLHFARRGCYACRVIGAELTRHRIAVLTCLPMKSPSVSRRAFLVGTAGLATVSIATALAARQSRGMTVGAGGSASVLGPYGPLRPVADLETSLPLLQLPEGFEYRSWSWSGDPMTNGQPTPDLHDGMGVISAERRGAENELVLVRNHECDFARPIAAPGRYDTAIPAGKLNPPGGGTTNLVFRGRRWISVEPSLGGTLVNCAGGVTPWGTWLSCEETWIDLTARGGRRHGYVFEVHRHAAETTGKAIVAMGRMEHEAVAIDPDTNYAYLTEDEPNCCTLYRFIPNDRSGTPGSYEAGGRLQAARVIGQKNADLLTPSLEDVYQLEWVDLQNPDAEPGTIPAGFPDASGKASGPFLEAWSKGALRMSRGEGICYHAGKFFVVDTTAGAGLFGRRGDGEGAVWEYDPQAETLRAIFVAGSQLVADNPDNITVSPRGGILLCEDGEPVTDRCGSGTRVLGLTAEGQSYTFAKNNVRLSQKEIGAAGKNVQPGDYRGGELSGVCFDPAGEVLFVNIQYPGITFAIWGPWAKGNL